MSAAAVMLVKDEDDVIEWTIRNLLANVDEVIVSDNMSTDQTPAILARLVTEFDNLLVLPDADVAYRQSEKTTALAMLALDRGHQWVVPCDADEVWYATDGRRIGDYLAGLAPDIQICAAELYDHVPTALDPPEYPCSSCGGLGLVRSPVSTSQPAEMATSTMTTCLTCKGTGGCVSPFARIGWRKRHRGALPKVACRLRPDLVIEMGNHNATTRGTAVRAGGLCVRHFSWRSAERYVRKIRNGAIAYSATDYPEAVGAHWRMHGDPAHPDFDERVAGHFRQWFWSPDPYADDSLIYDPAPVRGHDR